MRATGIIRRIDDLGRVVVPKEIRKSLNIQDGDPLEVYTLPEENAVVFKKYERVPHTTDIELLQKAIFDDDDTMSSFTYDDKTILAYHFNSISKMLKGE